MASAHTFTRVVPSTRGGNILEFSGHRYTRRLVSCDQLKMYWRCIVIYTCNATCTTNYFIESGIIVRLGKKPQIYKTTETQNNEIKVQEVVRAIKRRSSYFY